MQTAFDHIAEGYDAQFSHTETGRLQRYRVWDYLEKLLPEDRPIRVLELNCGTGEDALHLAQLGHSVLATDLSEKMIRIAKTKAYRAGLDHLVSFSQLDIGFIGKELEAGKFDLVLSDFGGLNCLNSASLRRLAADLPAFLNPDGHFVAVVMPDFCLWESFYFLLRMKWKTAFRRKSRQGIKANVGSDQIETWYYAPGKFRKLFFPHFVENSRKPIGIALPPSYLDPFFQKRQSWLKFLYRLESGFGKMAVFSGCADHFLMDFQLPLQDTPS